VASNIPHVSSTGYAPVTRSHWWLTPNVLAAFLTCFPSCRLLSTVLLASRAHKASKLANRPDGCKAQRIWTHQMITIMSHSKPISFLCHSVFLFKVNLLMIPCALNWEPICFLFACSNFRAKLPGTDPSEVAWSQNVRPTCPSQGHRQAWWNVCSRAL
jgi:hypothetical protein